LAAFTAAPFQQFCAAAGVASDRDSSAAALLMSIFETFLMI
jgi:hypothetical protein